MSKEERLAAAEKLVRDTVGKKMTEKKIRALAAKIAASVPKVREHRAAA